MIAVFGLLGEPDARLRAAAADADRVVGADRHLDALGVPPERRIRLGILRVALERVQELPADAKVVIVASGDPLFFGVVRSLRRLGVRADVVPAVSSIATAFARVGLPWDDAVVVSAHGRPLATAVNLARAHPKVAVFTSPDNTIRELAAGVAGLDRWFVLAERLGEDDERVRLLDAAAAAAVTPVEPNVVLVLADPPTGPDALWAGTVAGPSRPDRPTPGVAAALAFARLLPGPGELLWARGPLADEVAALAAWSGAATHIGDEPPAGPAADVLVTDTVDDVSRAGESRAVVLTGTTPQDHLPPGFGWTRESAGGHTLLTGVRA